MGKTVVSAVAGAAIGAVIGAVVFAQIDTAPDPEPDTGLEVLTYDETWDIMAEVWNNQTNAERVETCDAIAFFGVDTSADLIAGGLLREGIVPDPEAIEDVYTEGCGL